MQAIFLAFNSTKRKAAVFVIAMLILILVTAFLQTKIDAERAGMGLTMTETQSSASTMLKLLGGLRSAAAAYVWLKVDRLHDEFYGELSAKEDELIPLYRITTWLNPHIVDAYYVGSYLLYKANRPDEGWRFALEGLRMNPDSSEMELNVGQLALFYRKDYKTAITHLERAYKLAQNKDDRLIALKGIAAAYKNAGITKKTEEIKEKLSH